MWKTAALATLVFAAVSVDVELGALRLPAAAHAIIGRPMTPVSYAGAARRTVRRTGRVVVASTAVAATAVVATEAATASAARAAAPPPPAPSSGVPIGTIVATLPPGCVSAPIRGINYLDCGGVFYRPTFQSNNLVYVVQQP
jgi:hypothetical protein